jgi:hypothetical protein
VSNHPNATAAGIAGAITTLILWLVTAFAHLDAPPEVAAAITTVVAALVLLAGGKQRRHTEPSHGQHRPSTKHRGS